MKNIRYILLFLLPLFLAACDKKHSEAAENVFSYVTHSFTSGETIRDAVYSRLYVISTSEESKLPEPSPGSIISELSLRYESLTLPITLKSVGCTNTVFDNILNADNYFRKYDVMADKYVMFAFFEVVNQKGEHTALPGCYLLDSDLQVISTHEIYDKRYVYVNSIKR